MEEQKRSFLDDHEGEGLESIRGGMFSIPFLKIIQKGSPEVEEGNPAFLEDAKAGTFMNSLTKETYGNKLEVIVLDTEPVWLAWKPNRGGFAGKHAPGSIEVFGSPFDEGGMKTRDGNTIEENIVFYVLIKGRENDGPIAMSLNSTNLKHAKNWNSYILNTKTPSGKRAPMFGAIWSLELLYNTNQKGSWFMLGTKDVTAIEMTRLIVETEYIDFVEPNRKLFLDNRSNIDFAITGDAGHAPQISEDAGKY
jgi:hypothetical protein